ncbi:hypothetical protein [Chitinophaga parva]|nr:hypothetical protein [Chitinophaga parva]
MKKHLIQDYCFANDQLTHFIGGADLYRHNYGLEYTEGIKAARKLFNCF